MCNSVNWFQFRYLTQPDHYSDFKIQAQASIKQPETKLNFHMDQYYYLHITQITRPKNKLQPKN